MSINRYIDIYGQREDDHALELTFPKDTMFDQNDYVALNRLAIEWKSSFADENIFGIVDTDLIEYVGDYTPNKKPRQNLYTFTKTKNTTMTDIHVPNPAFHGVSSQFTPNYTGDRLGS